MCSTSVFLDGAARSALLTQARKGDRESLARLILPYAPAMYLGALRLTRNPADAEDVRQESFLKAMTRLDQFAGTPGENRDNLYAWVSRIATNASIDMIRKRRDGKLFSLEGPNGAGDETLGSNMAAREDNPEQRCARREMRMLMAQAITQLAPDLRQACLGASQRGTQTGTGGSTRRVCRVERPVPVCVPLREAPRAARRNANGNR